MRLLQPQRVSGHVWICVCLCLCMSRHSVSETKTTQHTLPLHGWTKTRRLRAVTVLPRQTFFTLSKLSTKSRASFSERIPETILITFILRCLHLAFAKKNSEFVTTPCSKKIVASALLATSSEHGDPRCHNTWIKIHPHGLTAKRTTLHV